MGKCPPSEENCLHPHSGDMELGNLKLLGVLFGAGGPPGLSYPQDSGGDGCGFQGKEKEEGGGSTGGSSFFLFL